MKYKSYICRTKYPIMLVHGIGYNDVDYPGYWGNIPNVLKDNGAVLYFGDQDGLGSVYHNAAQLAVQTDLIREKDGFKKINIIAHSKGGIDARYMISLPGMADRVASLTTIATPHRGIRTIDIYKENKPGILRKLFCLFNMMLVADGGDKPDSNTVYDQLTSEYMEIFNELVPDCEKVFYQSYACDMKGKNASRALYLFYRLIKKYEGPNDGLVPVSSAKWGLFRGVYTGPDGKGISHSGVCSGRSNFLKKKRPHYPSHRGLSDFYVQMVAELREMGF